MKKQLSKSQLIKANKALQSQVEFLIKYTDNLAFSYNAEGQRLAKRCSDLEKENQRLAKDLESELTYRDWDNLKAEVDDLWHQDKEEAMVKKLNDWIKNSSNPQRYELLLEYIYDMDIPAFKRLRKKAEVKLALLEKGLNVGQETNLDKIVDANPVLSKSVVKRLATQIGKPICPPENMVGYTSDRPLQWRDELGRYMGGCKEKCSL